MPKIEYQCLNNDCLKVFNEIIIKCPLCGCIDINELIPAKCDQCGFQDEGTETRTVYFGPDNSSLCENCVPRDRCSCNVFDTKEEGLLYNKEENLIEVDGCWIAVDNNGRLIPCVDYC